MNRDQLPNQVIREIIGRVASGVYADGHKLPAERALCQELGVSRGTLRKALADLADLGVVEIRSTSGVYVQPLSHATLPIRLLPPDFYHVRLEDIITARKAIELPAVALACEKINADQRQILHRLIAKMELSVEDLSSFVNFDMAFHQTLVRASQNRVLLTAFEAIYEYHKFSSVFTSRREGEEALALKYHKRLLEAVEKGDKAACRKILSAHLDYMKQYSDEQPREGKKRRYERKSQHA